jgi:hypothetical protein
MVSCSLNGVKIVAWHWGSSARIQTPVAQSHCQVDVRMNIYFSCSLTGGRADEGVYGEIVDHLLARNCEVPTAHLARPEVMALERVVDPAEVYQRDIDWMDACDAMVAEVSTPSHGVGYEIAYALGLKKPVLACYRQGATVSKMITGNNEHSLRIYAYPDRASLLIEIDVFLDIIHSS